VSHQVLIVEGNSVHAEKLQDGLKALGYRVTGIARSGEDAIRVARDAKPHVVLMDIRLNGNGNGLDAAKEIHAGLDIPVIFLSAREDAALFKQHSQSGVHGYVAKPVEEHQLSASIEIALSKHRAHSEFMALQAEVEEGKQVEEALRASQERLALHVEQTPWGIIEWDTGFKVRKWNPGAARIFGYSSGEAVGRHSYELVTPPSAIQYIDQLWEDLIAQKGGLHSINENSNKAGETLMCEWYNTPLVDNEGKVVGVASLVQDISKRMNAEKERLELDRQAQHAQKLESLGVLAGGIAHDFNNLLAAILGNAELALDDMSDHAPARDSVKNIETAALRAAGLAKQMLAYSGRGKFVIEAIHINEFVEEMAHILEVSISKKAVLKFNYADNLPVVDGDPTQIREIIMNLVTNASEAIGDRSGVIALSTGAMDCDDAYLNTANDALRSSQDAPLKEGCYLYVEVSDTGCGMDAETQEKVFDPFFTTKFTGRGLGMAAVLGIMRGHQGAIKICSEVSRGTTFKVLFPVTDELAALRPDGMQAPKQMKFWHGEGTILVADDEESVCAIAKRGLTRMGFKVLTACDGREAVDLFQKHHREIDCVLLDLTMPHLDGSQAFREMRRIRSDAKVILCSGYSEQDATERFAGKGLAGFLQKPYKIAALRDMLERSLDA
jgi:two-component system, cell cycle sensor histidine kinase and response regulator CckA